MMRIALVNDLTIALAGLRHVIASMDDAEVAWTAMNGVDALEQCRADTPDLILMDMIMPVMDGVESTRRIMQECPCPIIVVTATVEGNAGRVYEALGHGALDATETPVIGTGGAMTGAEALVAKIRTVRRLTAPREAPPPVDLVGSIAAPSDAKTSGSTSLIAIGASTGGPQALATVLRALPHPLPCPVVIVQHVDVHFAHGLATWLEQETDLPVRTVTSGDPLEPAVLIAATEDHLIMGAGERLRYTPEPCEEVYRPSVDAFFASLVRAEMTHGTAVLLTGMGRDGAAGLLALREAGWHTIAQDEATSVVWGMPGEAVRIDAACDVLPIDAIGPAIAGRCATRTARGVDP